MPGAKRRLEDSGPVENEVDKPSKQKRRLNYSEADAQLATLYNDLADEVQTVRLKAATELVKNLSGKSDDQRKRLDDSLTRLVKGLCSGRKAARLGFSIALTEVLRLSLRIRRDEGEAREYLLNVTDNIKALTLTEGKVSGQERRDHLLGQRFAFQAVLHSGIFCSKAVQLREWSHLVDAISSLAAEKPWLRRECGSMLFEYLSSPDASRLDDGFVSQLFNSLHYRSLLKTSDGVALWLMAAQRFPQAKLPKGVWHHQEPLSSKERPILVKIMQESNINDADAGGFNGGTRQTAPSFAWSILLSRLCQRKGGSDLAQFWQDAVDRGMFASSASVERKALGLQVFSLALTTIPHHLLPHVVTPNIVQYIITQRASSDKRHLFEASKSPLNHMVARAKAEPPVAAVLVEILLRHGYISLDQQTKTKTMESLLGAASGESLHSLVLVIDELLRNPGVPDQSAAEVRRRLLADMLLAIVRLKHDAASLIYNDNLSDWLAETLKTFVKLGYSSKDTALSVPPLSEASQSIFRSRLMSCLGHSLTIDLSAAASVAVFIATTLQEWRREMKTAVDARAVKLLDTAEDTLNTLQQKFTKQTVQPGRARSNTQGFALMFAISMTQVYNAELDSAGMLQDLCDCYHSWQDNDDASTVLVELLLSFVSKPSALFRKLAEQVFSAFASELTEDGLQSMLDILAQNESLSGQQELFDRYDSDEEMGEGDATSGSSAEDDDDEVIDVEDASDVELVNGEQVNGSTSTSTPSTPSDASESASGSDSSEEEVADADEDEEAIFDRKLAAALGTAAATDSDSDGSSMDDEQMLALEPHLASIFAERAKATSKKRESKDAKQNIVNFKNRVLDLLAIFVKTQYASKLALEVVLPLVRLVRTTSSKQTADKAVGVLRGLFDACAKHKVLPPLAAASAASGAGGGEEGAGDEGSAGAAAGFKMLAALHAEMKLDGSKVHAGACSRASLFVSKALVALDGVHYARIAGLYAQLQSEWYSDPKSKVQASTFTEWTSWSISTRAKSA